MVAPLEQDCFCFSLTHCDEGCFYNRVCLFFTIQMFLFYDLRLALAGEEAYFDNDDDDDDDDNGDVQNELSFYRFLFLKQTNKTKVSKSPRIFRVFLFCPIPSISIPTSGTHAIASASLCSILRSIT